jgi:hypothetical protein
VSEYIMWLKLCAAPRCSTANAICRRMLSMAARLMAAVLPCGKVAPQAGHYDRLHI